MFFVNFTAMDGYSVSVEKEGGNNSNTFGGSAVTLGGSTTTDTNWSTTAGYSDTPGQFSLIFKDGITEATICHEALHTLGMEHSFELKPFPMIEHQTDNIMDYAPENMKPAAIDKQYCCTYNRQWEVAWDRGKMTSEADAQQAAS